MCSGVNVNKMRAFVRAPSGGAEPCLIEQVEPGHYNIRFTPHELGVHTVDVLHREQHIPGSPFQFTVGPITGGFNHLICTFCYWFTSTC